MLAAVEARPAFWKRRERIWPSGGLTEPEIKRGDLQVAPRFQHQPAWRNQGLWPQEFSDNSGPLGSLHLGENNEL